MNKRILFRIGSQHQRKIGLGNIAQIGMSIYHRAKTWGYDDVWFEWPYRVTCGPEFNEEPFVRCPDDDIVPIKFRIDRRLRNIEFRKIVNLCDGNVLYPGYIPIYEKVTYPVGKMSLTGIMNYPNMYYKETGKRPVLDIQKDKLNKPYILFHYRNSPWSSQRNSVPEHLEKVFNIIKEKYSDKYEIWKCGERWPSMDNKFDTVSYYNNKDINKFFRLVNNASMFVGPTAGVLNWAELFNIPQLIVDNTGITERMPDKWKEMGGVGNTYYDWIDNDKFIIFNKEDGIEGIKEDLIIDFTNRHI
jgi:hypothetical protein